MGGRGASSGLFDTDKFEKVKSFSPDSDYTKIVKETDKAVAVRIRTLVGNSSVGYEKDELVWLPKSQVKIKDGKIVEAKGWLVDKKSYVFTSKKSEDRIFYKHAKKDSPLRLEIAKKYGLK